MKASVPVNPVLIVDDEAPIVSGYRMTLKDAGFNNLLCSTDSREALGIVRDRIVDAALIDLNMPHVSGEKLLEEFAKWQPGVPVIVVTGRQDVESAVLCMRKGAHDYLVKPVPSERVATAVRNAIKLRDLQRETERLRHSLLAEELSRPEVFAGIVTRNPGVRAILLYIEAIAGTAHPVLITGETGVGKELVARAIHAASGRRGGFVAVNAAGLDDNMFSDALFGHVKGAFTGAAASRQGLIAAAAGGTLFLDEIGDLATVSQGKLLRLLQENEYLPLGADRPVRSDARVVVATNVDLDRMLEAGRFRADLFYRLNTHKIHIPPLRKRRDDLPLLVEHFLSKSAEALGRPKPTAPRELCALLAEYDFPGNIRELESVVADAVSRHRSGMLSMQVFKEYLKTRGGGGGASAAPKADARGSGSDTIFAGLADLPTLGEVKQALAEEAFHRSGGNYTRAAEILGVTRQAVMWHFRKRSNGLGAIVRKEQ